MNMTIDLTQIIIGVITILFALLTRYAIPYAKEKLNTNQMELLRIAVKTFVYAADQIYTSEQGQEKKAYVIKLLRENGYDVDDKAVEGKIRSEVDALIESMVKELKIETSNVDKITAAEN